MLNNTMLFNDFKFCQGAIDVKGRALYVKGKGNMRHPTNKMFNPCLFLIKGGGVISEPIHNSELVYRS